MGADRYIDCLMKVAEQVHHCHAMAVPWLLSCGSFSIFIKNVRIEIYEFVSFRTYLMDRLTRSPKCLSVAQFFSPKRPGASRQLAQFLKHKLTWASWQVCQPGADQAENFVGLVWISVWLKALETTKKLVFLK
jgi:hypothetical protein